MKKMIDIPVQARPATVGTVDPETRTVELVWSSGAAVRKLDLMSNQRFYEELSLSPAHVRMDRLNRGAPLLNTHDGGDLRAMLGVVTKAWLTGTEGRAIVRFSKRAEVEPIWQDVVDGIIRNVSVGYGVYKYQDVTPSAEKIRRLLAVDWEPVEISMLPIGADAKAGVRSEERTTPCEFEFAEEPSAEPVQEEPAGQAAPPATRGGVGLDLLCRRLDLAEREV